MSRKRVWATSEDGAIEILSLTPQYLQEFIAVLRKSFFPYEMVCIAVGLSKNPEAVTECEDLILANVKHGVSVMAVEKSTGKIVGALLNKIQQKSTSSIDFYRELKNRAKHPEVRGILEYLETFEDCVDPFSLNNADCLLELLFLGVLPEYSRRGIGLKLCEGSINLATCLCQGQNVKTPLGDNELVLEPRPHIVTALFTSFKSQKIGRKLDFDILKRISYEDVYFNGRSYASIIGKETEAFTVESKKLE